MDTGCGWGGCDTQYCPSRGCPTKNTWSGYYTCAGVHTCGFVETCQYAAVHRAGSGLLSRARRMTTPPAASMAAGGVVMQRRLAYMVAVVESPAMAPPAWAGIWPQTTGAPALAPWPWW